MFGVQRGDRPTLGVSLPRSWERLTERECLPSLDWMHIALVFFGYGRRPCGRDRYTAAAACFSCLQLWAGRCARLRRGCISDGVSSLYLRASACIYLFFGRAGSLGGVHVPVARPVLAHPAALWGWPVQAGLAAAPPPAETLHGPGPSDAGAKRLRDSGKTGGT